MIVVLTAGLPLISPDVIMTPTPVPPARAKGHKTGKPSLFVSSAYVVGAAAFAVELLMAAAPAIADGADPSRVHFGDLDLNSDRDVAVLEQRIAAAARAACRAPDRISDPLIGYRRCIADTTESARPRLDQAVRQSRSHATQPSANRPASAGL